MKLILSLSHLRHNSEGAKPFSGGGAKCPLCPLLEKPLPVQNFLNMILGMTKNLIDSYSSEWKLE